MGEEETLDLDLPPEFDDSSFHTVKVIGSGAVYKGYLVEDSESGRTLLCKKCFLFSGTDDKVQLNDFKVQVAIMTALNGHLCIGGFVGYKLPHAADEKAKLFLEYYPKGTLANHIKAGMLSQTDKFIVAIGVCLAQCRLGNMGIVNGDIKPANIFLDDLGYPKVSGFAFASKDGQQHRWGGTPLYMAPEIWEGGDVTVACDVYAFAYVLYQLFVFKTIDNIPRDLSTRVVKGWRPHLPEDANEKLVKLITSCWDQEPSSRPTFVKVARTLMELAAQNDDVDADVLRDFITEADGTWLLEDSEKCPAVDKRQFIASRQDYRMESSTELGSGASATVYAMRNKATNQVCAGKEFEPQWIEAHGDMFEREVDCMALFNSPCIVKLLGYTPLGGDEAWIFMELMEGGKLSSAITDKSLTATEQMNVLYGIAYGMHDVHKKNIVHLDLKPDNVLLDKDKHSKVTDFGISFEKSMNVTVAMATVDYMAPEVGTGQWGPPSDVYSFAMILYKMLVNPRIRPPRWPDVLWRAQIVNGYRPPIPDTTRPAVKDLITRCWHQDPSARPTFASICKELQTRAADLLDGVDLDAFSKYCNSLGKLE